jgi:tRNASer (uridine44-2'-O)-methyltransferase
MHTLDSSFDQLNFTPPTHPHAPSGGFEEGLEPGQSRYKAYLMWLGWYGLQCGWEWEKEGLRVPSTRGWGIVGTSAASFRNNELIGRMIARKRWTMTPEEDRVCRGWVLERVNEVRARGIFNVREKEGKEHGKKHY